MSNRYKSVSIQQRAKEILALAGSPHTWEDLHACIARAIDELAGVDSMVTPDPRIVELSKRAYDRGEYVSTEDLLNDIAARQLDQSNN